MFNSNSYSLADIAAATGRNNDGVFGDNGGAWWIIILFLFVFCGWGNGNWGGGYGGGQGATSVYEGYVLSNDMSMLSRQVSDGFNSQERKLDSISNGLCDGFYTQAQLVNGVNTNILTSSNNITNAICDLGYKQQDCCCQTQRAIDGVNYNMATNTCAITNNATQNTRDIIDAVNSNYRALHDEIVANRIEDKNAQIQAQQNEINALRLAASQAKQNNYLINELKPCPSPAYIVPNPYCNCNNSCGCGI